MIPLGAISTSISRWFATLEFGNPFFEMIAISRLDSIRSGKPPPCSRVKESQRFLFSRRNRKILGKRAPTFSAQPFLFSPLKAVIQGQTNALCACNCLRGTNEVWTILFQNVSNSGEMLDRRETWDISHCSGRSTSSPWLPSPGFHPAVASSKCNFRSSKCSMNGIPLP